jgi:hypothetical protein
MRIQELRGQHEVDTAGELERVMLRRYGNDVNAFSISRNGQPPLLLILVNRALANLHFFPPGDHPGFHSVGHVTGLDRDKYTTFFMNSTEEPEVVPNSAVVSFSRALTAAKELLESQELPRSMNWSEL